MFFVLLAILVGISTVAGLAFLWMVRQGLKEIDRQLPDTEHRVPTVAEARAQAALNTTPW